jgi:hypothetical protein
LHYFSIDTTKKFKFHKKYGYLPERYWKRHRYCELLISQLQDLLIGEKFEGIKQHMFEIPDELIELFNPKTENIVAFFRRNNEKDIADILVHKSLLYSLIGETVYYLDESLYSSVKMRMSVCFTLLRKPFLEILIVILKIAGEDNFLENFSTQENFDPTKATQEHKKYLIERACVILQGRFSSEEIYRYLFDKNTDYSLVNICNMATHLFTDRNPIIKTEKQTLNFVFLNKEKVEWQWQYIYSMFPVCLTFTIELLDIMILATSRVDEKLIIDRFIIREKLKMFK